VKKLLAAAFLIIWLSATVFSVTGYQVECPPWPDCLECRCESPMPTIGPSATPTLTPVPTPTTTPGAGITIAHITDMHAGKYYTDRAEVVIGLINQSEAVVIVDTGDCTENGQPSQWRKYQTVMALSTIQWKAMPGNHDTSWPLGDASWYWDVGDYRLIGLNTRILDWTVCDAALDTEKLCLIFGHHPLDESGVSWQLKARLRLDNVIAYVSGHTHVNALSSFEDIALINGGRVSIGSWRLIQLDGRNVTVTFLNPWG